jgi:sterol desaturase/sphingolipid hydroxylase (fatty acid hydroxylase superfamily)
VSDASLNPPLKRAAYGRQVIRFGDAGMLQDIFVRLVSPVFAMVNTQHRYFWFYLLFAGLMALGLVYLRQRSGERSLSAALTNVFQRKIFLHPSALLDYRFALTNHILFVIVLGLMLLSASTVTGIVHGALTLALGSTSPAAASVTAGIVFAIALFVVTDLANFISHYIQHKVPVLWEFHKVHHSAEVLTPITAIRLHPISEIFSTQIIATGMGLVNGTFLYIYGGPVAEATVLGANALDFLYYTIGAYHLSHSHIWVMFPKGIREVFLSPALHLIHHSSDPRHFDKNFAFSLTIWDRLAGTLYTPQDHEQHTLALGIGEEMKDYKTVWQLYTTPLRNCARILGIKGSNSASEAASDEPAKAPG